MLHPPRSLPIDPGAKTAKSNVLIFQSEVGGNDKSECLNCGDLGRRNRLRMGIAEVSRSNHHVDGPLSVPVSGGHRAVPGCPFDPKSRASAKVNDRHPATR
jgi:hypothetical protein